MCNVSCSYHGDKRDIENICKRFQVAIMPCQPTEADILLVTILSLCSLS